MDINKLSNAIRTLDGNHKLTPLVLAETLAFYDYINSNDVDVVARIIGNSANQGAGALAEAIVNGLERNRRSAAEIMKQARDAETDAQTKAALLVVGTTDEKLTMQQSNALAEAIRILNKFPVLRAQLVEALHDDELL